MLTQTTDPITGRDVTDPEHAPFVVEGQGDRALKIFFESEDSKREYLAIEPRRLEPWLAQAYAGTTDKSMEM